MKKKLTLFLSLLLIIIILYVALYDKVIFYYNISKELLKLNNNLAKVTSDFYSDPITEITYKDIIYKKRNDLELKLDIYSSNNNFKNQSPVLIYVFGDSWMYGEKSLPSVILPIIDVLRNSGFTIISTSYELMDNNVIFEEQISDVKDTIRWVHKNKDIYGFDVDNIGLIAPSAGAQLAMMAAYSENTSFIGEPSLSSYPSDVEYVIDLFGPSNLSKINISTAPKEIVTKLNNYNLNKLSDMYSPINYIKNDLPDTLIIHSEIDDIVPFNSSLELYYKALRLNNNFDFLKLSSCSHYMNNLSKKDSIMLFFNIISYIYSNSFY